MSSLAPPIETTRSLGCWPLSVCFWVIWLFPAIFLTVDSWTLCLFLYAWKRAFLTVWTCIKENACMVWSRTGESQPYELPDNSEGRITFAPLKPNKINGSPSFVGLPIRWCEANCASNRSSRDESVQSVLLLTSSKMFFWGGTNQILLKIP